MCTIGFRSFGAVHPLRGDTPELQAVGVGAPEMQTAVSVYVFRISERVASLFG